MSVREPATEGYWNEALETLPWSDVLAWQAGQITPFLAALPARSPMYRRLHARVAADLRIRSLDDLQALPFTVKDDIRAAQDEASEGMPLGANQGVPTDEIVQVLSSSGTTGAPLYYALTAADVERITDAVANTFFTAGIRRHDIVAHLVGLPMVAGGLPYADGFRRIGATLCWLGGFPTERILREMRRLRVSAVLATTSFGLYLSEQWGGNEIEEGGGTHGDDVGGTGAPRSSLRKILCGGEPGLNQPEVRHRIARGLGTEHVRETMGLGDVIPSMWGECSQADGMHFNAQRHVAVELVDPASGDAVPWRDGATGELVYSALARDATPLVRYRSRDHAVVTGTARCACGRTSPRIRCIGRTDDMLIYRGMNVFPTAIRDLVVQGFSGRCVPMMRLWREAAGQVRFDDPIAVDVEAAPAVELGDYESLARAVEALVRSRLQVRVAVTIVAPGSLPRGVYKNALLATRHAP
jgi:phenylacetate-coenzyme A ligase PaaK-like adenylate-forming protein